MTSFRSRALFVISTGLGFIILLLLMWRIRNVLLLAFAGVIVSVLLLAGTDSIKKRTGLGHGLALALMSLTTLAIVVIGFWLFLPPLITQVGQLSTTLPGQLAQLESQVAGTEWGQALLARIPSFSDLTSQTGAILGRVTGALSFTLNTLANTLLVIVTGIFIASEPGLYRRGALHLVPPKHRDRAGRIMDKLSNTLRAWLVAQLIAMSAVGVLTWLGLLLIGVPAPLALGVIAGVLDFVPFFGPVLGALPALLIALSEGLSTLIWVALLYIVVQQLEGNLIQPLVQKKAVNIPPAVLVLALVVMGQLFGILGLLIATPLTAVVLVLVKQLYIDEIEHHGDDAAVPSSESEVSSS